MSSISVSVTNQPITAAVGSTAIDVSVGAATPIDATVGGGFGPAGPPGTTSWAGIVGVPSEFSPALHAVSHAIGGVDYIAPAAIGAATIATAASLQLQIDGKAANNHTHAASAITSGTIASARLPNATVSSSGAIIVGTGLSASSGVLSVTYGSSSSSACRGDDSRLSNSREWSASTVSQAEAEAGTDTTRVAWTVQRVWQAIAAWWNASAAKTKLDGIASGATANQTDAHLLSRANHTGTQTASTISDFTAAVVAAAPPTTDASLLTSGTLPDARLSSNIARTTDVSSAVAALVNSSPATLDTLAELASALGSDANFSTTVTNSLSAKAPINNPTFTGTVGGVTKSMVGLGNVDNTSDANKPVSTATQTALDGKAPSSHSHDASAINAGTLGADRLPLASANTRGAVRIGSGISIDGNGVISASSGYTLPTATDSVLGGVRIGEGVTITDGVISVSTSYAAESHAHAWSDITSGVPAVLSGGYFAIDGDGFLCLRSLNVAYPVKVETNAGSYGGLYLYSLEFVGEGEGAGILFPDDTLQNTAWPGSLSYNDLDDLPSLFDGSYASLSNVPASFSPSSHSHGNLSNDGLVNGNTTSDQIVVTTTGGALTTATTISASSVSGLATVATSGSYDDLDDLPTTYTRLSDTVSNVSYIGLAPAGSATSASVWRIKRTTISTNGTVSASVTATNVAWTNRLTASYS